MWSLKASKGKVFGVKKTEDKNNTKKTKMVIQGVFGYPQSLKNSYKMKNIKPEANVGQLNVAMIKMQEGPSDPLLKTFFGTRGRHKCCLTCLRESLLLKERSGKGTYREDPGETCIWSEALLLHSEQLKAKKSRQITSPGSQGLLLSELLPMTLEE